MISSMPLQALSPASSGPGKKSCEILIIRPMTSTSEAVNFPYDWLVEILHDGFEDLHRDGVGA